MIKKWRWLPITVLGFTTLCLLSTAIFVSKASAVSITVPSSFGKVAAGCEKSFLGLPSWYQYLDVGDKGVDKCAIIGPTDSSKKNLDWPAVASRIALAVVDILLRIGGLVSVAFVMVGGFKYITSQGEPENTKNARNTILNAVIGLVIVMMSVAIVNFAGAVLWH